MERNIRRGLTIGKYASTINAWLNDKSISTVVSNKNASGKIIQHKRVFFFFNLWCVYKTKTIDFAHTRPNPLAFRDEAPKKKTLVQHIKKKQSFRLCWLVFRSHSTKTDVNQPSELFYSLHQETDIEKTHLFPQM